ncbi:sialomucin core protein 24 isoform X2 [Pyxicephalus adspersus]|uniref:sialomucin core protein 24 isoform X2 n=1 Tax=Pyxicephalus adspersus TaxID=30357 RepID=UPI003B5A04AB
MGIGQRYVLLPAMLVLIALGMTAAADACNATSCADCIQLKCLWVICSNDSAVCRNETGDCTKVDSCGVVPITNATPTTSANTSTTTPAPTGNTTTITTPAITGNMTTTPAGNTTATTPLTTPASTGNATTSASTTAVPTASPSKKNTFDAASFIGGIVLVLGIQAVVFFLYKFCKAKDRNYHTL